MTLVRKRLPFGRSAGIVHNRAHRSCELRRCRDRAWFGGTCSRRLGTSKRCLAVHSVPKGWGRRSLEDPLARRALITGITGQDGSYLAEHLLEQGYEVWGAGPRAGEPARVADAQAARRRPGGAG
ncbi:GDP-mannose 4,6-dehydratase [Nonomuraea salmonea]|uniref:GDP-mannose 4,6-dehydratase n=1 Tax=Nonomuraea salmonea TaxID=46181 RepID=UPI0031EBBD68